MAEAIATPLAEEEYDTRFEQEVGAFEAMHAELMAKYAGKWVAVLGGKVVDVDTDDGALYERMLDNYGEDTPFYMQVVVPEVVPVVDVPHFEED